MMLLGLVITLFISLIQRKHYEYGIAKSLIIPIMFLVVAFLGGKLMYILENFHSVYEYGIQLKGMSLFGAIFLFPLFTYLVSKFTKIDLAEMLDYCTPFGIILLCCTRTGCFINGCCGAITFWNNGNPIILPVQLMEVALDLIILEVCFYFEKTKFKSGMVYPLFMMLYGICRFGLEFLRKTEPAVFIFSNGQIFSIICLVLGFILFQHFNKRYNTTKKKKRVKQMKKA